MIPPNWSPPGLCLDPIGAGGTIASLLSHDGTIPRPPQALEAMPFAILKLQLTASIVRCSVGASRTTG